MDYREVIVKLEAKANAAGVTPEEKDALNRKVNALREKYKVTAPGNFAFRVPPYVAGSNTDDVETWAEEFVERHSPWQRRRATWEPEDIVEEEYRYDTDTGDY